MSVAAAGTKQPGSAADEHDSRESAKAASVTSVKEDRNRRYDQNVFFVFGKQGHKQWGCPQSQQGKAGKDGHGRKHDQSLIQRQ